MVEVKLGSWKLFIIALLNVCGYFLQLKAVALQEASRVIPIVQTYTLFTILLGIFLLNERDNLAKKIIAGIIGFVGAYLLL